MGARLLLGALWWGGSYEPRPQYRTWPWLSEFLRSHPWLPFIAERPIELIPMHAVDLFAEFERMRNTALYGRHLFAVEDKGTK